MTSYYTKMRALAGQGQWVSAYELLRAEVGELADLLEKNFSEHQLADLAKDLPFDGDAANLIWKRLNHASQNTLLKEGMLRWATPPEPDDTSIAAKRYKKSNTALYVAAAAQYGLAKALTEIYKLSEKKLEMVNTIHRVVDQAKGAGLELFLKALSRSTETDADKTGTPEAAKTEPVHPVPVADGEPPQAT